MEQQGSLPLRRTRFRIAGHAQAFPSITLKNSELATELGVDPEWIQARCGVLSRHISGPGETTTTLGVRAARLALSRAPWFQPDLLVCATFTPDYPLCPCGPSIAHALELGPVPAFDLNAACSGGVLGLLTALSFIAAGTAQRVLLVAADTVTHHLADDDAQTRILFGDGAAAFLIESCPQGIALRSWVMGSDGSGAKLFHVPHGGSAAPWQAPGNGDPRAATVSMQGRPLFRFASQRGTEMLLETCAKAGIRPEDLDWVLVHQANTRIVEQLQERSGIAPEKWIVNMMGIGNTCSASVLLALGDLLERKVTRPGDHVLLAGFGAGLTWAAALFEWGDASVRVPEKMATSARV
ncbi:MAG TPA: ketoacyl-ACP synthase III [Bryobacteraceae bacterium]|nr:ketoacyl-ACP synthase III [Bryobacteraceae bacterium]